MWGFTSPTSLHKIELLQKRIIRVIANQHRLAHTEPIFKRLKLLKVYDIAKQQVLLLMHIKISLSLPPLIDELFKCTAPSNARTRNTKHFFEPFTDKLYRTRTVSWIGPRTWNKIMASQFSIKNVINMSKYQLKKLTKEHFLHHME